ncbi:MAG: transglutaminase family protein, partial [Polyangiales bacterium]
MKFGLTHRLLVSAVVAFGVAGLARESPLLLLAAVVSLALSDSFRESARARYLAATFAFVVTAAELARIGRAPASQLAIETLLALQILRVGTRRGATHDLQIVFLALAQLVLGAAVGGGSLHRLAVVGFVLVAPGALALSYLRREVEGNYALGARDRMGSRVDVPRILRSQRVIGAQFLAFVCLASLPVIVVSALSLTLVPHFGSAQQTTGFDGKADLGGIGPITRDSTIVLRFKPSNLPSTPPAHWFLRLRGTAFDRFESGAWTRTSTELTTLRADRPTGEAFAIELEAIEPTILFLPPHATGVQFEGKAPQLAVDRASTVSYAGRPRRWSYRVFVGEETDDAPSQDDRARYLQLPNDSARIEALARAITNGATDDRERARRIAEYLQKTGGFRYTLDQPSGAAESPIDDFLFTSKAGHCAYFSTAMALMLRTVGIPSRNVTGFAGGTWNRFGEHYVVRKSDAHAWVEAWVGSEWTTFDPTPSSPIAASSENALRDAYEALSRRWEHDASFELPLP